ANPTRRTATMNPLVVLIALALSVGAAAAVTDADKAACTPDFMKFCSHLITENGVDRAAAGKCMVAHRKELSRPCTAVAERLAKDRAVAKQPRKKLAKPRVVVPPIPKPKPSPPSPLLNPVPVLPPPTIIVPPPALEPPPPVMVAPPPAPPPPVIIEPTKGHHMEHVKSLFDFVHTNLAVILTLSLIGYFVAKNGAPSVIRWFIRMW